MIGQTFGPFRIERELGRGPSGVVYQARDAAHDDRVVALKIIAPHLSADAGFRALFRQDAAVLGRIREPHVVPVHGIGEVDGRLYVDMRLVRGGTLADALAAGPLEPGRAAEIAGQIGSALDALRRGGLGSRAVTPADVLLSGQPGRSEFVQLVGLGLGRPPVDPGSLVPPEQLVLRTETPPRGRRRLPVALTAAALVVALLVAGMLALTTRTTPTVPQADVPEPAAAGLLGTVEVGGGLLRTADAALLDGRPVLLTASGDGAVRTLDPTDGAEVRPPITGRAFAATAVEVEGRPMIAALQRDGAVALYDLDTQQPGPTVAAPAGVRPDQGGDLTAGVYAGAPILVVRAATGRVEAGRDLHIVQAFTLPGGEPIGPAITEAAGDFVPSGPVEVAREPAVVGLVGGRVIARSLVSGADVTVAAGPPPSPPNVLIPADTAAGPVAVSGDTDNGIRVWDLGTGQVGAPITTHTQAVTGLGTATVGGTEVLISRDRGGTIAFHDLDTGLAWGTPLTGHPLNNTLATNVSVGDTPVLLGVDASRITVWDLSRVAGM